MPRKNYLAGLLTATVLSGAAAAQEFKDIDFTQGVRPYEDIDITIYDLSGIMAPDEDNTPRMVFRTCAAGKNFPGPQIGFFGGSTATAAHQALQMVSELPRYRKTDPTFAVFMLAADGKTYDLHDPGNAVDFGMGLSPTGQSRESPEFARSLRRIAESCLPGF